MCGGAECCEVLCCGVCAVGEGAEGFPWAESGWAGYSSIRLLWRTVALVFGQLRIVLTVRSGWLWTWCSLVVLHRVRLWVTVCLLLLLWCMILIRLLVWKLLLMLIILVGSSEVLCRISVLEVLLLMNIWLDVISVRPS